MAVLDLNDRIQVLISMGNLFRSNRMTPVFKEVCLQNPWFTIENIELAIKSWAQTLNDEKLLSWLKNYPHIALERRPLNIQVLMAGNLPLVGLHDLISVFISGHYLHAKLSSKDSLLMPWIINNLAKDHPGLLNHISFPSQLIDHPDAAISTGSNQTISIMEENFSSIPGLYRGNRNSIAFMNGSENSNDLDNLIFDIRSYFGFGCRNVSYLFIPDISVLDKLQNKMIHNPVLQSHHGYSNNIKQQKAILRMNNIPFIDAGDIIFTESRKINAGIGLIHYQIYHDTKDIRSFINDKQNQIQCVIGDEKLITGSIGFGESQFPELWDYADKVDTLNFLLNLNE